MQLIHFTAPQINFETHDSNMDQMEVEDPMMVSCDRTPEVMVSMEDEPSNKLRKVSTCQ